MKLVIAFPHTVNQQGTTILNVKPPLYIYTEKHLYAFATVFEDCLGM